MQKVVAVLLMVLAAPAAAEVEVNCYRYDGIERELCENQNAQIELEMRFQELREQQEDLMRKQNDLMRKREEQMWNMEREAGAGRDRN